MNKIKIKKGDLVIVNSGKESGKTGKVVSLSVMGGTAVVEGLNKYKKHAKPSNKYPQGGIIDLLKPMKISNLQIICSECKKATRVKISKSGKAHTRICKKCNGVINVT